MKNDLHIYCCVLFLPNSTRYQNNYICSHMHKNICYSYASRIPRNITHTSLYIYIYMCHHSSARATKGVINPLTPRRTLVAPFTNISILF